MHSLIKVDEKMIRVDGHLLRVARLEADKYHFLDNPQRIVARLNQCGTRIDLFTFLQRLPDVSVRYSYPMEYDNLAVLPVSTYNHWWGKQIDNKTRNMIRKATKSGVELREVPFDNVLARGIWEIYNECPVRQGKAFRHYGKEFEAVRREMGTFLDTSFFIGAFLGDRLLGFAKLTHDETRTQAGLMSIVAMMRERDKAPTNGLIAHAVRSCAERGIAYLVYGNFTYGKKENDSVSHFKKNNGFERVEVPRYYVPMTLLGSIGFRLGAHHKLAEHVPESIVAKLRGLRAVWYEHEFQSWNKTS